MKKQIGWYDPDSCHFYDGDKDDGCHDSYTEQVFIEVKEVDTRTMAETLGKTIDNVTKFDSVEELLDDLHDKIWHEIQLQILENQVALLLVTLQTESRIDVRHNLGKMRKYSVELLEKGRKLL